MSNETIMQRIESALESLIEVIEWDGSLIHSEQCGCDVCESLAAARAALAEGATP